MKPCQAAIAVPVILAAACSTDAGRETGERRSDTPSAADLPVDTLITTGSGVLGEATDLAVASDGMLFVLDGLNGHVHRVGPDGRYAGSFAGAGAGPSELTRPSALAPGRGDTLWVADSGNGRLQAYTAAGEHLAVVRAHGWIAFPSHITRDGLAMPEGSLVTVHSTSVGRRATSSCSLATSIPTKQGEEDMSGLRARGSSRVTRPCTFGLEAPSSVRAGHERLPGTTLTLSLGLKDPGDFELPSPLHRLISE